MVIKGINVSWWHAAAAWEQGFSMQSAAGSKPCPVLLRSTFCWSLKGSQVKVTLPPLVLAQRPLASAAAGLEASASPVCC